MIFMYVCAFILRKLDTFLLISRVQRLQSHTAMLIRCHQAPLVLALKLLCDSRHSHSHELIIMLLLLLVVVLVVVLLLQQLQGSFNIIDWFS